MKRARSAQAGLTMVEVVVATIILSAIVFMSAYLVWSTSQSAASAEAALQLESTAREALDVMAAEFREAKRTGIQKVTATPIRIYPPIYDIHGMDPADSRLGTTLPAPTDADFDAIRFELIDPRNVFNLDNFKNASERKYTIQYWWQVEYDEQKGPPDSGTGPNGREPNLVDDNKNGVVDEGVILKMETWFKADGTTVEERKLSTVLKNVKKLAFRVPSATPPSAPGDPPKASFSSDRIEITLDLEIQDPKHGKQKIADAAGKESFLILKKVSKVVDFRN